MSRQHAALYRTALWQRIRQHRLNCEPLCTMCAAAQRIEPATVVDHIKPHRGDRVLFFDFDNTQSLCKRCHDKHKQREEWIDDHGGAADADGYPTNSDW